MRRGWGRAALVMVCLVLGAVASAQGAPKGYGVQVDVLTHSAAGRSGCGCCHEQR